MYTETNLLEDRNSNMYNYIISSIYIGIILNVVKIINYEKIVLLF